VRLNRQTEQPRSVPPSAQPAAATPPSQPQPPTSDPLEVGGPIPVSIGRTADLYSDVRQLRLSMEKEVERVKARETELREHIIANLSKSDDTGAAGLRYRAQIVTKDVPRAVDWPAMHAYVQKTGRFDLLQKRLGEKAVMDMVADGQPIPGVEIVKVPDVSITKIGR
jgi:hypothetical protein